MLMVCIMEINVCTWTTASQTMAFCRNVRLTSQRWRGHMAPNGHHREKIPFRERKLARELPQVPLRDRVLFRVFHQTQRLCYPKLRRQHPCPELQTQYP